jgi:transketolase
MRNAFCSALVDFAGCRDFAFLTGDLGFMALEPLQAALGKRFINAGIAEQNMITVCAGIASVGLQCWAYSIAPFVYARPFEQIRNDVCLHDADVKLVGNGGGYGYGVMGATHHALEDYGVLLTLPNIRVVVPAFADDIAAAVASIADDPHPVYLRLGRCEKPAGYVALPYAPWRCLLAGARGVMIAMGPLVGPILARALDLPEDRRPEIWAAAELPLVTAPAPEALMSRIDASGELTVVEEHGAQGGLGQILALDLARRGVVPARFRHLAAQGYASGRYGSQHFHRAESGLDADTALGLAAAP